MIKRQTNPQVLQLTKLNSRYRSMLISTPISHLPKTLVRLPPKLWIHNLANILINHLLKTSSPIHSLLKLSICLPLETVSETCEPATRWKYQLTTPASLQSASTSVDDTVSSAATSACKPTDSSFDESSGNWSTSLCSEERRCKIWKAEVTSLCGRHPEIPVLQRSFLEIHCSWVCQLTRSTGLRAEKLFMRWGQGRSRALWGGLWCNLATT